MNLESGLDSNAEQSQLVDLTNDSQSVGSQDEDMKFSEDQMSHQDLPRQDQTLNGEENGF